MLQAERSIDVLGGLDPMRGHPRMPALNRMPSLLIADDDAMVLALLSGHFKRLGFDVETASDGFEAFLKVTRGKPSLLVIDVNMPELDGLSVCTHLLDADRAPAHVIVITSATHPDILQRCESAGTQHVRKGPRFWNDLHVALMRTGNLV